MRAVVGVALLLCAGCILQASATRLISEPLAKKDDRVAVEIYKMSRCPDAIFVEKKLNKVLRATHKIVDLKLHYIADGHGPDVVCKHGPEECDGNRQQLCVAKYGGKDQYRSLWKFVRCQDKNADDIGKASLAEDCLSDIPSDEIDADKARQCFNGYEGLGLLRGDIERSRGKGVVTSASIFIEGKLRCVRDGGEWYACSDGHSVDDFIDSICAAYEDKTGEWPKKVCGKKHRAADDEDDKDDGSDSDDDDDDDKHDQHLAIQASAGVSAVATA